MHIASVCEVVGNSLNYEQPRNLWDEHSGEAEMHGILIRTRMLGTPWFIDEEGLLSFFVARWIGQGKEERRRDEGRFWARVIFGVNQTEQ